MTPAEAEITKASSRDRILRDVMTETPEEDRGRLLTVAIDSMPDKVAFIDWIVVVSILSLIGIVNLHDDDVDYRDLADHHNGWKYKVDDDGRNISLIIFDEDLDPFDLPAGIVRLERLADLRLRNCRSLPAKELSCLLYLKALSLALLENIPAQMELKYLKTLYLTNSQVRPTSPFLPWMAGQLLPSLEALYFYGAGEIETNYILDALRNLGVCLQSNLEEFRIKRCELNDNQLETLLFEVLPRFPNMNSLDLILNEIQSVESVVDRLRSDKTCFISKSIRYLNLQHNPIMKKMMIEGDPKETAAILSFLQTFNTVCNLGGCKGGDYDPDVEYALRINHAGRNIVEGSGDRPLPLSVWPIVLERSFEKSGHIYEERNENRNLKNPTGLYYLLRNGPALAGRVGLVSDGTGRLLPSSDHAVVGNDDEYEEEEEEDDVTENPF